jgi:hypothetical protein
MNLDRPTLPRLHLNLADAQRTLATRKREKAAYEKERRSVGAPPSPVDLRRLDDRIAVAEQAVIDAKAALAEREGGPTAALQRLSATLAKANADLVDVETALAGSPEAVRAKMGDAMRTELHAVASGLARVLEVRAPQKHGRLRLIELADLQVVECKKEPR